MDKNSDQKSTMVQLYPPIDPFEQRMLNVGNGHTIYVEQCGKPNGIPVIVLHGGPGAGCSPTMRRYFDPQKYRVILFDQRGCGRSRPHASVTHNTTWHLIDDIEKIRKTLRISQWCIFGGSWGATLALLYAQAYSDKVLNLILRGIFLMTKSELDWFYAGGAGKFWPNFWNRFISVIPQEEQSDLIAAYHRRLFCNNISEEIRFAQEWANWENTLASMDTMHASMSSPKGYVRAFSRLENHYFLNNGFLEFDGYILSCIHKIESIPGIIVQGRYDMICPPTSAYQLSQFWPSCKLRIIENAGHALSEPSISVALIDYMNQISEELT
ncbi:MAG: prolyl aminopeptidase [Aestuariivita sp.]|nr:prolyl aminopeptidase [Aestuariivita sp.]